jgi:very-short-patch-repair endonuclease/predicted transcriptional regulator of viral defense system
MMGYQIDQSVWALARSQHGVVTRGQLLELGFGPQSIKHRVAKGRLHPIWLGIYAVGRPQLSLHGRWMGAVLCCGAGAVLSHASAAALWEIRSTRRREIEVSVPVGVRRRRAGIVVHRRVALGASEKTQRHGIPVTTPIATLIDLAARLHSNQLEAAINEADKHDLTDPETLRTALDEVVTPRPGAATLRRTLDRRTFTLTDSELERRFLPLARRAGLPRPETGRRLNGFRVDFYWPDLRLVVETDGLRYHRTPAQQARDRLRDQAHAAAGLTPLRFTHAQIRHDPGHVRATLAAVGRRLRAFSPGRSRV